MAMALLPIVFVKILPFPFILIFVVWIAGLIFAAKCATTSVRSAICVNIAVMLIVFLCLEAYWINKKVIRHQPVISLDVTEDFLVQDPFVGYKPAANYREEAKKTVDGELSYSVVYTTDSNGYRITPDPSDSASSECLLFLGCSYTWGAGVNDDESMPYLVASLTGKKTYNMGVSGYGPHQVLASIEFDQFPKPMNCSPKVAVFQTIYDHIHRTAGLGQHGRSGPKYILSENNELEYLGQLSDINLDKDTRSIREILFGKSYAYQEYVIDRHRISDGEVKLYLEIVAEVKRKLKEKFPGIKFVILYWDDEDQSYQKELDEKLSGIADEYVRITEVIPDINNVHREKYSLHNDYHPNAVAHQAIAKYLSENIIY
jgi:hypothetical protein